MIDAALSKSAISHSYGDACILTKALDSRKLSLLHAHLNAYKPLKVLITSGDIYVSGSKLLSPHRHNERSGCWLALLLRYCLI